MAMVILQGVWLHDASDLADYQQFTQMDLAEDDDVGGEVREYAGGVRRNIRRPGQSTKVKVTVGFMTPSALEGLRARNGSVQVFRDSRGRCWRGRLSEVSAAENRYRTGNLYDGDKAVTFSLEKVTFDEAV